MRTMILIALFTLLAAIGPNIFPAAMAGYSDLSRLATHLLVPAVLAMVALALFLRIRQPVIWRAVVWGGSAGAVATLALEAVRLTGYHLGWMPGNLPRLMGVLLLNRFANGPDRASDIAGWLYHFWNGVSFGIIYALLIGARRIWAGAVYGIALGVGFMLSPVVSSLGVGFFGLQFSAGFPVTVLTAHAAYGISLAWLARRWTGAQPSVALSAARTCFTSQVRAEMASNPQQS